MRAHLVLVCACLALLLSGAGAAGADSFPADLLGNAGDQHVDYPSITTAMSYGPGMTIADVGDVNGDGREDVATGFGSSWPVVTRSVYVTFSSPLASSGAVAELPGFRIDVPGFQSDISAAGDINGDGLADIAVLSNSAIAVVFGRVDGVTVDTSRLGDDGFRITGGGYESWSMPSVDQRIAPLGDVDGDGVPDLLVSTGGDAAIVYPPRDAAGMTIDAWTPGPHVAVIRVAPGHLLGTSVGALGDIDGDGRTDLLLGGEEEAGGVGADIVAYGVAAPLPGATVTLPAAVGDGRAFSVRLHDYSAGGTLIQATTVSDQNGDGRRDVALVSGGGEGPDARARTRVVYAPAFGSAIDASDLRAADARGWSVYAYAHIFDVGDQNGDGVGDIGDSSYVYFPDPAHEPGTNEPAERGFFFRGTPMLGDVAGSIADVNGDGRRELIVSRFGRNENNGVDASDGETMDYAIDVYDSATAPTVLLPDLPVLGTDGQLHVEIALDGGAGSRGGGSLALHPTLEIATPDGPPHTAADPGVVSARQGLSLAVAPARALGGSPLVGGASYRVRATVTNGRGLQAAGPWRSFTYSGSASARAQQALPAARPAAARLRLRLGSGPLRLRDGRVAVRLRCDAPFGRCRGTLRLSRGTLRLGRSSFSIAAGRQARVRVRVPAAARRALRRHARVRVRAIAEATGAGGMTGHAAASLTARLH